MHAIEQKAVHDLGEWCGAIRRPWGGKRIVIGFVQELGRIEFCDVGGYLGFHNVFGGWAPPGARSPGGIFILISWNVCLAAFQLLLSADSVSADFFDWLFVSFLRFL